MMRWTTLAGLLPAVCLIALGCSPQQKQVDPELAKIRKQYLLDEPPQDALGVVAAREELEHHLQEHEAEHENEQASAPPVPEEEGPTLVEPGGEQLGKEDASAWLVTGEVAYEGQPPAPPVAQSDAKKNEGGAEDSGHDEHADEDKEGGKSHGEEHAEHEEKDADHEDDHAHDDHHEHEIHVTVVGQVGGSEKGKAAFILLDESAAPLEVHDHVHGEEGHAHHDEHAEEHEHHHGEGHDPSSCPFCQAQVKKRDDAVIVKFLDRRGNVISHDAEKLFGLTEGQKVFVKGHALLSSIGMEIIADGIYVEKE